MILMEAASCWEQTLVAACTDGTICCLDLESGSRCAEFDMQMLCPAGFSSDAPSYQSSILQPHSCVLDYAKDGLLWLQGTSLCQLDLESESFGAYQLPRAAVRLLALPDGICVAIGFDDGSIGLYRMPLLDTTKIHA